MSRKDKIEKLKSKVKLEEFLIALDEGAETYEGITFTIKPNVDEAGNGKGGHFLVYKTKENKNESIELPKKFIDYFINVIEGKDPTKCNCAKFDYSDGK